MLTVFFSLYNKQNGEEKLLSIRWSLKQTIQEKQIQFVRKKIGLGKKKSGSEIIHH